MSSPKHSNSPEPHTEHNQLSATHLASLSSWGSVRETHHSGWKKLKNSVFLIFVRHVLRSVVQYVSAFALAPATFVLDPLSTFATIVVYPVVFLFLCAAVVASYILRAVGFGKWMTKASKEYSQGYSVINWANPDLFKSREAAETISSARATLSGGATTFPDAPPVDAENIDLKPGVCTRIFDLDVAKTFLIFSSLVYERKDALVDQAINLLKRDPLKRDEARAEQLIFESEALIRDQASQWNLKYEGVACLASSAGPFASIFYTLPGDPHPFIVLVFKGTTPTAFSEFLVDATISRVSEGVFFGGGSTVHRGFASDLLPNTEGGVDSYGEITRGVRHISDLLLKHLPSGGRGNGWEQQERIPLWVTGHSLGAALASLIFARYLLAPDDLGDKIELRDCYTFGAPKVGDGALASKVESVLCNPINRANILWRVSNNFDVVCDIPPGISDAELNRAALSPLSMLNYAHLGAEFHLSPFFSPYYRVDTGSFHSSTRFVVVKDGMQGKKSGSRSDTISCETGGPLKWGLMMLPDPVFNHFPASYYTHLNEIQVEGQGGSSRLGEKTKGAARKRCKSNDSTSASAGASEIKEGLKG